MQCTCFLTTHILKTR